MDGTFLRSDGTYDKCRFSRVLERLRAGGVRFAVVSGNQDVQLRGFFDDPQEFAFVSDNGAMVIVDGSELVSVRIGASVVEEVARFLEECDLPFIASGPGRAFALAAAPRPFVTRMRRYYPRLETVEGIQDVSGQVFKFALSLPPKEARSFERALHGRVGDAVVPVTSGHGELDLGCPGVTKASGLDAVLRRWDVGWAEVAAFGDSANDLPMLRAAGLPVAMAGATDAVKAACLVTTEANDDDGVLNQLERWFPET